MGPPTILLNNTVGEFHVIAPGMDCKDCPTETGCKDVIIGTTLIKACFCTHDHTPLRIGEECKRNIVNDRVRNKNETERSITIPIHVPNDTDDKSPVSYNVYQDVFQPLTIVMAVLAVLLVVFLLLGAVCYLKRKSLKRLMQLKNHGSSIDLKTYAPGRLLPDRFINNPTYESSVLAELSVPIYTPDDIKILTQIGQGCYGKVFKGELNGESIAVKMVKNEHSEEATKEVETMAAFSHPNILHLIGIARSSEMECPWLLFEFMEHGDLAGVLRNSANKQNPIISSPGEADVQTVGTNKKLSLTIESLMDISYQIGEGMKYLSSQHFVHRDLAARNCLVSSWGMVKISDFGLSRDVYTCDYYKIGGSRLLPIRWMAPESILYGRFTLESDVWAYGILLWEIYSWGKQPYYGHSNEEVVQLILDGVLLSPLSDCPKLICEIMAGCWKTDPKDRLKFSAIQSKFTKTFKAMSGIKEDAEEESLYEIPKAKEKVEYMEVV